MKPSEHKTSGNTQPEQESTPIECFPRNISMLVFRSWFYPFMDALWSELWQMERKSCLFQSLFKHIFRSFEGKNARCFQKPWQRWQGRRPAIRQVGQKEPRTHLHLKGVVSPNLTELSGQKQTMEPFFETANHATSNQYYQYEKCQRVMQVPSCELKRETWSEFTYVCVCVM